MENRSGLVLIRDIEEMLANGASWEDVCARLNLKHESLKRFVRDMAIRQFLPSPAKTPKGIASKKEAA